jgi:hypothetical protein
MRQGWKSRALCAALALGAAWSTSMAVPSRVEAAAAGAGRTAKIALRQFTGVVASFDKTSLTVERKGKSPRSMVFTRHPEMKISGEVVKNARVTVYYRDEGGKAIAHRVVVRPARSRSSNGGS